MEHLLAEFLREVEQMESRLLVWGLVDGFFSEQELRDRAEYFLDLCHEEHSGIDKDDFLEEMIKRGLLFRWEEGGAYRFRTRMAETVRLMAGLRQLFPKHLKRPGEWQVAPSLVSDFRFLNRPRQYPQRDQSPADWIPIWSSGRASLSSLQTKVMSELLKKSDGQFFDVSGFQVRACSRILEEAKSGKISATMVCAGTGSGKTLAFYLPAITHLVGIIEVDSTNWVRALAIYPRNELLKDQISEALSQTRKIRPALAAEGRRPVSIGTLFGPTPKDANDAGTPGDKPDRWRRRLLDPCICPFLVCPECGGGLEWRDEDRKVEFERLKCQKCPCVVDSTEVILTRKRIQGEPPDILFTTTEMMNQRLTDTSLWKLFGVGTPPNKKPVFLLLDEAHTYNSTHGAQVAYLLRRWLQRSRSKPHVVGLSATLMEASSFFADLTGIRKGDVEEISPEQRELKPIGMEYLLALRGDPVSGASLLSTSIQASMLIRRMLDANQPSISNGVYGKKVFLFTDDLDANNRMFFNLRDAEGQNSWGKLDPVRHPLGSLANLRSPRGHNTSDEERRFVFGQSWRLSATIGHQFDPRVLIPVDRVSSQDSGVAINAEVIVATASLEVGFNDPSVGAVIQHKAPRDPASFLQRKGRAGRRLEMRPWTIVVLSDFGRDRLAYQGYDLLFDPELRPRELPLGNRHVLKMQAVFAFIDWLGSVIDQGGGGHVWREISQPRQSPQRQAKILEVVSRVLSGEDELERMSEWLKYSLHLSREEVLDLLWEPPRALMTSVIPTLKRRLESGWEEGREQFQFWKPLPEFIPPNLFGGLNLPEIEVETFPSIAAASAGEPRVSAMRIDHALREFAPGRISKRFGTENNFSRHWVALDPQGPAEQVVDLSSVLREDKWEPIGEFSYLDKAGDLRMIRTIRPYAMRAAHDAPRNVKDSSNAFPEWNSQLQEPYDASAGIVVDLPSPTCWDSVIREIRFFVHSQFCPARIRRFSRGSNASILLEDGSVSEISSTYSLGGEQTVALGFAFEADAIRIRICPPEKWHLVDGSSQFKEKLPSLRSARYRWLMSNDSLLQEITNVFGRKWIAEICLSAIVANAIVLNVTPEEAWASVRSGEAEISFTNALEVLFQTIANDEDSEAPLTESKRFDEIREFFITPEIIERLDQIVPVLWAPINEEEWRPWLTERFLATLGAAFREAIQQICPNVDADGLLIDIDPGAKDSGYTMNDHGFCELWISETEPGGGGVIERFLPEIAEAPRRFLDLTKSALDAGDFEQADLELSRFIEQLVAPEATSEKMVAAVDRVRSAQCLEERAQSFDSLRSFMFKSGFVTSHVVIAALNSRILKPGSNPNTDELTWELTKAWRSAEERLGIEVDARSLAYAKSASEDLDAALSSQTLSLAAGQDRRNWRFNAIYGILWPRGSQARNQALSLRNPFATIPETERFLVLDAIEPSTSPVEFLSEGWRRNIEGKLVVESRSRISCGLDELVEFKKALFSLLANPLDTGLILVYPRLRGIAREPDRWVVDIEVIVPGSNAETEIEIDSEDLALSQSRLIVKSAQGNREEVRDLLESILAVELLSPGIELWLVSPWITDVPVLDNRAGSYSGLDPAWPKRHISLAELLGNLLERSPDTKISVVTRPSEDSSTARFCERLRIIVGLSGNIDRLNLNDRRENLHTKGLICDQVALSGSMNFTNNGISVLEETVQFQIDEQTVSQFLISFHEHYGYSLEN